MEGNQTLPYLLRNDYLSPEQISFFKMLLSAVGDTFVVIPRVNLPDIFRVIKPENNRHFSKSISQKRIDFLLCDRNTMHPLVGVDLDDQSDSIEKPPEHEIFIDDIFEAAKLPLVRIFVSNPNSPEDLRERLLEAVGGEEEESDIESQLLPEIEWGSEPGSDRVHLAGSGLTEPSLQVEEQLYGSAVQPEEQLRRPELQSEEPMWGSVVYEPVQEPVQSELFPSDQGDEIEVDKAVASLTDDIEDKPVSVPADRRFFNSQPEQTPGIDFFTGSVSDVGPPPAALEEPVTGEPMQESRPRAEPEPIDTDPGLLQPGKKSVEKPLDNTVNTGGSQSKIIPHERSREEKASPGLSSGSLDLEQLKEKMKQEVELAAQEAVQSGAPACPRCNASMVLRTSKRGHQFYACANYPHCREVRGLYE